SYNYLLTLYLQFFLSLLPRPHRSTLFPYTTLFRSLRRVGHLRRQVVDLDLEVVEEPYCRDRDNETESGRDKCFGDAGRNRRQSRSEEHTSELQSLRHLVCRLLLEKKKK